MSGQIVHPNRTDQNTFSYQKGWEYYLDSCYRPAPKFHLPIICSTFGIGYTSKGQTVNHTFLEYDSLDYVKYGACCPFDGRRDNSTAIWTLRANCGGPVCFLLDEGVAKSFEECLEQQETIYEKEAKENGTLPEDAKRYGVISGWCEYIDYKMLKKGVKSQSSTQIALSVTSIMAIGFWLFIVGSGLF